MAKAYLVLRVKGQADVPHWARTTMKLLKLEKKYRATIVPATDTTRGMLQKIQTFVSWCEASEDITKELVEKRARKTGYQPLTDTDIKDMGYDSSDAIAESLYTGKVALSKLKPLKPWFALAPPRLGFRRSTKRLAGQKGILGKNKDLPDIIRRMI
ncbi:MAG: 50S ribosomal protein L30 [Cenarchaeum sp. SB0663_bin_5]|nr:50S ribosomal protein L30 [Cenarchaeum sp. SB0663_bin_5]MYH04078.1 50S ribosomal protein L30 [Cenarchaeum sp. SB0675_bin_21]MYH04367.1 50S ribosomal protein L30 [Cenarchaeum sp. SB0675_bin_21]MYL10825.1 50S ribosomal protein L30 [Cenarchaeum sp. SB0669_bin_11]